MTRTNSIPPLMTFLSTHSFRLGVFLLTAVALVAVPCPAADKGPNILFIMADRRRFPPWSEGGNPE